MFKSGSVHWPIFVAYRPAHQGKERCSCPPSSAPCSYFRERPRSREPEVGQTLGDLSFLIPATSRWPSILDLAGEDLPKNPEKSVTAKADVVRWLKASFDVAQDNYPKIDKQRAVKFLGRDATCEGVLLRALAHANRAPGADYRVRTGERGRAAVVEVR